jgi:hypothetical protein
MVFIILVFAQRYYLFVPYMFMCYNKSMSHHNSEHEEPRIVRQPTDPERHLARISRTVELLGIDKDAMQVVGGAVLAVYGIRSPEDVDIVVGPQTWRHLMHDQTSPSGVPLSTYRKRPHVLTLSRQHPGAYGLGADIKTNYMIGDEMTEEEFEEHFRESASESPTSANGIHFASLADTIRYSQEHPHYHRKKTEDDLGFIKRYLESYLADEITEKPALPFGPSDAEKALAAFHKPKTSALGRWFHK